MCIELRERKRNKKMEFQLKFCKYVRFPIASYCSIYSVLLSSNNVDKKSKEILKFIVFKTHQRLKGKLEMQENEEKNV